MKFGDLQPGQEFVIWGRKTPIGFIALKDGCAYYGLDKDVPVTDVVIQVECGEPHYFNAREKGYKFCPKCGAKAPEVFIF